jgi:hypothetical protein
MDILTYEIAFFPFDICKLSLFCTPCTSHSLPQKYYLHSKLFNIITTTLDNLKWHMNTHSITFVYYLLTNSIFAVSCGLYREYKTRITCKYQMGKTRSHKWEYPSLHLDQIRLKKQSLYCCSAFHSHSSVLNNEKNSFSKMFEVI